VIISRGSVHIMYTVNICDVYCDIILWNNICDICHQIPMYTMSKLPCILYTCTLCGYQIPMYIIHMYFMWVPNTHVYYTHVLYVGTKYPCILYTCTLCGCQIPMYIIHMYFMWVSNTHVYSVIYVTKYPCILCIVPCSHRG